MYFKHSKGYFMNDFFTSFYVPEKIFFDLDDTVIAACKVSSILIFFRRDKTRHILLIKETPQWNSS